MGNLAELFQWANLSITFVDIIEILIITFLFYHIIVWVRSTKAWSLVMGILVIAAFVLLAAAFQMSTILWIAENTLDVGLIALVIIFQPELRKALENLGQKNKFKKLFKLSKTDDKKFSDHTIEELIKSTYAMGKVKTGARMVLQNEHDLGDYVKTGIDVDAILSSQLIINIFEKNTPLHDGAVIINGDRVVSATCYLPLSDNTRLSKDLGTRHRAAVGISEASDSLTIIVSEETGRVSIAQGGRIHHDVDADFLRKKLQELQNSKTEESPVDSLRRRFMHEKK